MFNLDKHTSSLTNLNVRIEKHGDERQTAVDVKLTVSIPAESLDDIHPGLCRSLYRQPASGDQIALIDKRAEQAFTIVLHPCLEPLQLKQKFPGYELALTNLDGEGEMFFADVEIKNFTIKPHEGGSTTVAFTASTHVDDDEIGGLLKMLREESGRVTLTPPTKQAAEEPGAEDVKQAA